MDHNFFVDTMCNNYEMMLIKNFRLKDENTFKSYTNCIGCYFTGTLKTTDNNTIAIVMVPNRFPNIYVDEILRYIWINT